MICYVDCIDDWVCILMKQGDGCGVVNKVFDVVGCDFNVVIIIVDIKFQGLVIG